MRCPCCGANLIYKGKMKVCEYCGFEEKDTSAIKDYNVLVSYPAGTTADIKVTIPDARISFATHAGESRSLKLVPGPHNINFVTSLNGLRASRIIYVPDNDEVVKVSVWFDSTRDSSLHVEIDQPKVDGEYGTLHNGLLPFKKSAMATISLILACTFVAPVPAIILGMIDIKRANREGRSKNPSALCGMLIGWLGLMLWTMILMAIVNGS